MWRKEGTTENNRQLQLSTESLFHKTILFTARFAPARVAAGEIDLDAPEVENSATRREFCEIFIILRLNVCCQSRKSG